MLKHVLNLLQVSFWFSNVQEPHTLFDFVFDVVETTGLTTSRSTRPVLTLSSSQATELTSTGEGTTPALTLLSTLFGSTYPSAQTTLYTGTSTGTTSKRCEEMQAIDEITSKKIVVPLVHLSQEENTKFQPTSSQGVSFPDNIRAPTIFVDFGKPAEVQSITIPRDKTPNANVQQFEVIFYSSVGKKLNDKPISSSISPKDDKTKAARLDTNENISNTPVSRIEITIVYTTDGESPKGVILDVKACTEPTTGKTF